MYTFIYILHVYIYMYNLHLYIYIFTCIHARAHMCANMCLQYAESVFVVFVQVVSGLIILHLITSNGAHPWE